MLALPIRCLAEADRFNFVPDMETGLCAWLLLSIDAASDCCPLKQVVFASVIKDTDLQSNHVNLKQRWWPLIVN